MTLRGAVVFVLAALGAACDPGTASVTVRTDPEALAQTLERVEVAIVERCDAQGAAGEAPVGVIQSVEVRRTGDAMAFGSLERGERGLYARGWDASCDVVAAGCATVSIGDGDLEVTMSSVSGPGCAAGDVCEDTRCVTGDAGSRDAGPGDAGPPDLDAGFDGGPTDAGPPPTLACPGPTLADEDPIVLYTFESPDSFAAVADRAPAPPDISLAGVPGPAGEEVTVGGGMAVFVGGHLAATQADSELLQDAILARGAFSVEAWFNVRDLVVEEGAGPERVVTLSESNSRRSFTMGPEEAHTELRVRTSISGASGFECNPMDITEKARLETRDFLTVDGPPTQLVLTFDEMGGARAYIDGVPEPWDYCPSNPGAPTLDWAADVNQLLLGDELGSSRALDGTIFRVAIYPRALSAAEVRCWFMRGPDRPLYE